MTGRFESAEFLSPIGLEEMDCISLMNRMDTKYLTDVRTMEVVLGKAADSGYLVLELLGRRIHEYRSMYYDTPDLQMYLDHHNGRLVRQKLRIRSYESTGQTFLELKSKNNHGRTKKKRLETEPELYWKNSIHDTSAAQWLDGRLTYPAEGLAQSLETVFSRMTLVNPGKTERSTIDFDLSFNNVRTGTSADMGDLAVIEVKQDGNLPSRLRDILLESGVHQMRISKYCIGTAMTDGTVKAGMFKQKLMMIDKLKTQI